MVPPPVARLPLPFTGGVVAEDRQPHLTTRAGSQAAAILLVACAVLAGGPAARAQQPVVVQVATVGLAEAAWRAGDTERGGGEAERHAYGRRLEQIAGRPGSPKA
jgi:hypothetical protein